MKRLTIPVTGLSVLLAAWAAVASPAVAAATPHRLAAHHVLLPRTAPPTSRPAATPLVASAAAASVTETSDWSGYAAAGGTYKSVSASWTEPAGTCSSGDQYSSSAIGLDTASTSAEIGSEVDCAGATPEYYSWYEMYPSATAAFGDPVSPGDQLQATVIYSGTGSYTLYLTDTTRHWTTNVSGTLGTAAPTQAEVTVQAPDSASGVLPLAHFSPVTFSNVTVNGSAIGNADPDEIIMVDSAGQQLDSISPLSGGNTFSASWLRSS